MKSFMASVFVCVTGIAMMCAATTSTVEVTEKVVGLNGYSEQELRGMTFGEISELMSPGSTVSLMACCDVYAYLNSKFTPVSFPSIPPNATPELEVCMLSCKALYLLNMDALIHLWASDIIVSCSTPACPLEGYVDCNCMYNYYTTNQVNWQTEWSKLGKSYQDCLASDCGYTPVVP